MQKLHLPPYHFRTQERQGKQLIFDALRKRWVSLTPEEWVRQNFIQFLIQEEGFPSSSIGIEVGFKVQGRMLRADGIVYDPYGEVKLLLEFKAPQVAISEQVFAQVADYNTQIGAPYVVVSNGLQHFIAQVDGARIQLLNSLPAYSEL